MYIMKFSEPLDLVDTRAFIFVLIVYHFIFKLFYFFNFLSFISVQRQKDTPWTMFDMLKFFWCVIFCNIYHVKIAPVSVL